MSETNPYIVKETRGDYENTIQYFVTGRPLTEDEMLPDSHGVHPVSPLGFMMKSDGTPLVPASPLSGFMTYDVFKPCPECGGSGMDHGLSCTECGGNGHLKCATCDGTGTVEDPDTHEQVECPDCRGTRGVRYTVQEAYLDSYIVRGKYYLFDCDAIAFPVLGIHRTADGTGLVITVNGLLTPADTESVYFRNATSDDYAPTGLVGEGVRFMPDSVTPSESSGTTEIVVTTDIALTGKVGEGKLTMCVATSKRFLAIEDPDSDTASGIYITGETAGEPIRKVFNWYGDGEGRPCYEGNGYSDSEVERWVSSKMSGVVRYGCHPSIEAGDLRSAGGFVTWFASCGDVDISGGAGKNSVIVPGFGLGQGYQGVCTGEAKELVGPGQDELAERKWLTFGYGTKHDAMRTDVGKTALPQDWPFTDVSGYSGEQFDNNITLAKEGVVYDDGHTHTVLGGLSRVSRECGRCDGTGSVLEDGIRRICTRCHGTGEEPDCEVCHGTGEIEDPATHEQVTCPECRGQGFLGGHRYVMDKVHVCLYNDFTPSDSSHGHEAGTTVLKKTFVNLATPITQKDGDEFEITVSLPNIGISGAYSDDTMKNLSGYYAYVSQPRVYVVSGTWKFSDTKVSFSTKDLAEYDLGGAMFKDRTGNDLADGTDIRVKIMFDAIGRGFSATGKLDDGKIVLAEPLDIPQNLLRRMKRHADADGSMHGSICGAAYVEPNNGTLPEAVKTNLGLNAVRNENGALGLDMGDGTVNTLQQYNKIYTSDTASDERSHVLFDGDSPMYDQRQIAATVYPTMTNTFPWALTCRRKLGFLDRLMTMDADAGSNGLYARVYRMNRDILNSLPMVGRLDEPDYPLDMYTPIVVNRENERLSFIGAMLTVVSPDPDDGLSTDVEAQPVRRAIRAASMLASDYRNARVSRLGSVGYSNKVTPYVTGTKIRKDGSPLPDYSSLGTLVDIINDNEYESMANAVRLRHLPADVITAGTNPVTGEPLSPELESYPYSGYPYRGADYVYYSGNPYGYGEFDTTSRTEEVPCEVTSAVGTEAFAMKNSLVSACLNKKALYPIIVSELCRSAELHAVDFGDEVAGGNAIRPHVYRDDAAGDVSWMEAIDAFTKLVSPDNIPAPELPEGFDYGTLFSAGTNDTQMPFIMTDTYGYYKVTSGWEGSDFIATSMPTADSVAMFLKEYVPGYAARLAVRNWDGYRVKVVDGAAPASDTTYLTRMKWYDPDCDSPSRGIYASDAFLVSSEFSDMNMNRIEFATSDEALALNYSVPPYTVKRDYNKLAPFATQDDPNSVSYVRVFMKFAFSEDAGRWYCVDYRQAPVSYLSPLYGAKALDQQIDGKRLWIRPECDDGQWQAPLYHTYEEYRPLDINTALVSEVMSKDEYGECRLMVPYLPVEFGGLGLNAPVNKRGTATTAGIESMPHANFWNVREHLRPATGATPCGDIPRYYKDGTEWKWADNGGIMSDAVLWGQYDYPRKGVPDYRLPDTVVPDADLSSRVLIYGKRNEESGIIDTGDIQVGSDTGTVIAVSLGTGQS